MGGKDWCRRTFRRAVSLLLASLLAMPYAAQANAAEDTKVPFVIAASAEDYEVVLYYNEYLRDYYDPDTDAFTVKVNDVAVDIDDVDVDYYDGEVEIDLDDPIRVGDTIKVSYNAANSTYPVEDVAGNKAPSFVDLPVVNVTETLPPVLYSGTALGDEIMLHFREDEGLMDFYSTDSDAFTIKENGEPSDIQIAYIDVWTEDILLKLDAPVEPGATYTISYDASAALSPVQDYSGNLLADFQDFELKNISEAMPPLLTHAAVSGETLRLYFSEELQYGSVSPSDFTVTVNGSPASVSYGSYGTDYITLTLANPAGAGRSVAVSYDGPNDALYPIRDLSDNAAAAFANVAAVNVTESTKPMIVGARVSGATVSLSYSEQLATTSDSNYVYEDLYTVWVNGEQADIGYTYVETWSNHRVNIYLQEAVSVGDDVYVDYAPGDIAITDANGNWADPVAQYPVANVTAGNAEQVQFLSSTTNGEIVTLEFSGDVYGSPSSPYSAFKVIADGEEAPIANVQNLYDKTVRITLSDPVEEGQEVQVTYDPSLGGTPLSNGNGEPIPAVLSTESYNLTESAPPELVSASYYRSSYYNYIYFDFGEAMRPNFNTNDFTITVDGSVVASKSGYWNSSRQFYMYWYSSGVPSGGDVTVSYNPVQSPLKDISGNLLGAFTDLEPVDLTYQVVSRPIGAYVEDNQIRIVFTDSLNDESVPPPSSFAVAVDGVARTVSEVSVDYTDTDQEAVTLTMTDPILPTQTVTVSYAPEEGEAALVDYYLNPVGPFTLNAANPDTESDEPPIFLVGVAAGNTVRLTFSEGLYPNSVPAAEDFVLTVAGTTVPIESVELYDKYVYLDAPADVTPGKTVTLSYTPGEHPLRDSSGNPVDAISNVSLVNLAELQSALPSVAGIVARGPEIYVIFSETMDTEVVPPANAFAVVDTSTEAALTVEHVRFDEFGAGKVLVLDVPDRVDAPVSIAYAIPGSNALRDASGDLLGAFELEPTLYLDEGYAPPEDTTPPAFDSGFVSGTHAYVFFDEYLEPSSPLPSDFTVTATAGDGTDTIAVESVDLSYGYLHLLLAESVAVGAEVSVAYAKGAESEPIVDEDGNALADFAAVSLSNETTEKPIELSNGTLDTSRGIKASVDMTLSEYASYAEPVTVLFVLMQGTTPIDVLATEQFAHQGEPITVTARFNRAGSGYAVKVYVFDRYVDDTAASVSLANELTIE